MKWLWNNSVDLLSGGAVLIGVALVSAFLAHAGFGAIFQIVYLGSVSLGAISLLCGAFIFCLRFGVSSDPDKVIIISLFAQLVPFVPSSQPGQFLPASLTTRHINRRRFMGRMRPDGWPAIAHRPGTPFCLQTSSVLDRVAKGISALA